MPTLAVTLALVWPSMMMQTPTYGHFPAQQFNACKGLSPRACIDYLWPCEKDSWPFRPEPRCKRRDRR